MSTRQPCFLLQLMGGAVEYIQLYSTVHCGNTPTIHSRMETHPPTVHHKTHPLYTTETHPLYTVETHPLYFKTTPTCSCWNLDVLLGSLENFVNVFQNGFPGGTRWVGESYLGNVTGWVVEKRDNYLIAHHGYRLEEDLEGGAQGVWEGHEGCSIHTPPLGISRVGGV